MEFIHPRKEEISTAIPKLKSRDRQELISDNLRLVACVFLILLILVCAFRHTIVDGASMESTLHDGQHLILMRTGWFSPITPRHGDIVVAHYERGMLIKRVIACPGDSLMIFDNQIYRNGVALQEGYLNEPMQTFNLGPITLAPGEYFLMGDNRNHSADSRHFGVFSTEDIFGVVYLEHQLLLLVICVLLLAASFCVTMIPWGTKKRAKSEESPAEACGD